MPLKVRFFNLFKNLSVFISESVKQQSCFSGNSEKPHPPQLPAPKTSPTVKRVPLTKSHPDWGRLPAS